MEILKRKIAEHILPWMNQGKALIILGARQVGKTTLLKQIFPNTQNILWLNADDIHVRDRFQELSISNLRSIVGSYKIIIIDEVQRIKNCGLMLKLLVDNFEDTQVLATGSSALEIADTIFEPLTGRNIVFKLYGFTLRELYPKTSPFEMEQHIPFHLIYGTYPEICTKKDKAYTLLSHLSDQYLYKDVLIWKDIRKPELLQKLLKLLAFQIGSEVSINELANNLKVKSETVESYIDLLEKSFVIFTLNAFSNNPRKEITKMSKIYFWDNGIRNSIVNQFNPIQLRDDSGPLWENFIITQRLKHNANHNIKVESYFWRNYNQSEVDYIEVHAHGQIWAYEFKYSTSKKSRPSKAFMNAYPAAHFSTITPRNITDFLG